MNIVTCMQSAQKTRASVERVILAAGTTANEVRCSVTRTDVQGLFGDQIGNISSVNYAEN